MAEARMPTPPRASMARSSGVMVRFGCYHDRDSALNTNVMQLPCSITCVKSLAERLKWARERKGWGQEQLAAKAGVSQGTIGNAESGLRKKPRELVAIANALEVSPAWLETGKGTPDFITIDGQHRLFGVLKDLDLSKVVPGEEHLRQADEIRLSVAEGESGTSAGQLEHAIEVLAAALADRPGSTRRAVGSLLASLAAEPDTAHEVGEQIRLLLKDRGKRTGTAG